MQRKQNRRRNTLGLASFEAIEPRLLFSYPPMTQITGAANPLNGFDVGALATPALGDLDGDGDLDAVVGESLGTLLYFKNTGSATSPVYTPQTAGANPLNGRDVGEYSAPTLGDVDGDGDLDAFVGTNSGTVAYFRNTGNSTSPGFTPLTGTANPLNTVAVGLYAVPALGDVDGDGDLDVFVGANDGTLYYYKNTGSTTSPVYTPQTAGANLFNGVDLGVESKPALGDADGDGDLDAVVGERNGTLEYFKNTGTATNPVYVQQTGTANPYDGINVGPFSYPTPAWGDVDGDGDLDAVVGANYGAMLYVRNDAVPTTVKYTPVSGGVDPFNGLDIGNYSNPVLNDLDRDGDRDVLVGASDGTLRYYKNTGTPASPVYVQQTGGANPFDGIDVGGFAAPALGDLDFNFSTDLVVGAQDGTLYYYKNSGGYVPQTGTANPFNGFDVGTFSTPVIGDINGDSIIALQDLLVGSSDGTIHYIRNTGPGVSPVFVPLTGPDNPWDSIDVGEFSAPTMGDVDNDADLDLAVGAHDGTLRYFKNLGTRNGPNHVQQTGAANPFDGFNVGVDAAPSLGDVDGDGDLDAVVGAQNGTLRYFRNDAVPRTVNYNSAAGPLDGAWGSLLKPTLGDLDGDGDLDAMVGEPVGTVLYFKNLGTTTNPAYEQQTGPYMPQTNTGNPFNGFDIGSQAAPSFGDLDADGDLDVIVGEINGGLQYWRNNGNARNPAFQVFGVNADVGEFSTPTLGDLDGDGDLDFVVGAGDGSLHYFKNVGTATGSNHVEQGGPYVLHTNTGNPFNGVDVGGQSAPALGDVDGDSDLDLVVGRNGAGFVYFKNTGTATIPAYAQHSNPFGGVNPDVPFAPALGDLDHDGDADAIVGQGFGPIIYLRANRGPVVDNAVSDQTFTGPGSHSYTVSANAFLDLDKNALTYSATRVGGGALPAWMGFNPATRTFSGNPGPADTSPLQIRVIANDGDGGTGFDDFQLTLTNVADNFVVNTVADEDNGNVDPSQGTGTSLREAINSANSSAENNPTITFASSLTSGGPATITLGATELAITGNLTITGPAANLLTVSGNNLRRVFNIGAGGNVSISRITIANGSADQGGAILNNGTLNLSYSIVRNNTANLTSGVGGAISSYGPLTIDATVFADNNSFLGGAINSAAALTVTNSTLFGNDAQFNGGALRLFATADVSGSTFDTNTALNGGGAIFNHGNLTLSNSTIANNTALDGGGLVGWDGTVNARYVTIARNTATRNVGGLWVAGAAVTATNVIVAGNSSPGSAANLSGTLQPASSNNLLNMTAAAAGLGTLDNNGGSTQTISLLPNSPAINAGVPISGISGDQRGIARPQGSAPDIGAYERSATAAALTSMSYEFETRQAVTFGFTSDASVTFSRSSYTLQNLTTGQTLPASIGSFTFNTDGTQAVLVLTNLLPDGNYRLMSAANRSSGVSAVLDFFVFAGDANRDRTIDIGDFSILASRFNQPGTFSQGDFDYTGVTDIGDFAILSSKFNTSLPAARSIAAGATGVPRETTQTLFSDRRMPELFEQSQSEFGL